MIEGGRFIMTFYDWISEYKNTELPIGKLARHIYLDPKYPHQITRWDDLKQYLKSINLHQDFNEIRHAFEYYQMDVNIFNEINK